MNIVIFALLTTKYFSLVAECELYLKHVCMKSGFKDFTVLQTLNANLGNSSLPWLTALLLIVSCCNWGTYHYGITSKHVPVFSLFFVLRGQGRNPTQGDNS